MKRFWINLLIISLYFQGLAGQSYSGNLEIYLNSLIDIIPGSGGNQYVQPDFEELAMWENMVSDLLSGQLTEAREKADLLNYKITQFEDLSTGLSTWHYVVEEKNPQTRYWGTYVINKEPIRPQLVIQAPHPVYDSNTGYQGVYCYCRLGALALFFSGAHRCNSSVYTDCSGSTTVCSENSEPYRISDPAHNAVSVFQATTQVLFDQTGDSTVFVQLHGFSKLAGDPYVIISNGTRITPDPDYIGMLIDALYSEDNLLTFKVIHMDLDWSRLTAFTNTQGRYINGSSDPCTQNATGCSGRFIHIEQERSRLRADSSGWYTMFMALESTFPQSPVSAHEQDPDRSASVHFYPNPADKLIRIEAGSPFSYSLFSGAGQLLLKGQSFGNIAEVDLGSMAPGIYTIKVINSGGSRIGKIIVQ